MYRQVKCLDEIVTNHIKHNKKVEKAMFSPKSIILYDSYPAFSGNNVFSGNKCFAIYHNM